MKSCFCAPSPRLERQSRAWARWWDKWVWWTVRESPSITSGGWSSHWPPHSMVYAAARRCPSVPVCFCEGHAFWRWCDLGGTRQPYSMPPSVSTPSHHTAPIQPWTLTYSSALPLQASYVHSPCLVVLHVSSVHLFVLCHLVYRIFFVLP